MVPSKSNKARSIRFVSVAQGTSSTPEWLFASLAAQYDSGWKRTCSPRGEEGRQRCDHKHDPARHRIDERLTRLYVEEKLLQNRRAEPGAHEPRSNPEQH